MRAEFGSISLTLAALLAAPLSFCTVLAMDSDAESAAGRKSEIRVVSFRNGVDGYQGTVDSEIWALAPMTILESNPNSSTDGNNDGGESQCLMRFDRIVGDDAGQVPKFATVHRAQLRVSAFDQGSTVNLHRMLVPFDRSVTWNRMVSGVSADGLEAARRKDSFTFGKIAANSSEIVFDVTDTVQDWVNGEEAHGWVFLNTGGNGWDFDFVRVRRHQSTPAAGDRVLNPPSPGSQVMFRPVRRTDARSADSATFQPARFSFQRILASAHPGFSASWFQRILVSAHPHGVPSRWQHSTRHLAIRSVPLSAPTA